MADDFQANEIVEQEFIPRNDAAESVRELFKDNVEEDGRRGIDFRTELSDLECKDHSRLDFLVHVGIFRNTDVLTHSIKRNLVSKNRKGREETVEMFKNLLPSTLRRGGFWGRMFGGQPRQQY
jgi:hypothetical protein